MLTQKYINLILIIGVTFSVGNSLFSVYDPQKEKNLGGGQVVIQNATVGQKQISTTSKQSDIGLQCAELIQLRGQIQSAKNLIASGNLPEYIIVDETKLNNIESSVSTELKKVCSKL